MPRMRPPRFRLLPATMAAAALVLVLKVGEAWQALAQGTPAPAPQAAAQQPAQPAAAPTEDGTQPLLPPGFSPEELAVLQGLSARRQALDERDADLALRDGRLEAAEKRIDAKLEELARLKRDIDGLIRKYDAQEEKEIASLVKVYETMKPKDAARILEQVEFPILIALMERIKERSTAPILAAMSEPVARRLTAELVRRRELKAPGG